MSEQNINAKLKDILNKKEKDIFSIFNKYKNEEKFIDFINGVSWENGKFLVESFSDERSVKNIQNSFEKLLFKLILNTNDNDLIWMKNKLKLKTFLNKYIVFVNLFIIDNNKQILFDLSDEEGKKYKKNLFTDIKILEKFIQKYDHRKVKENFFVSKEEFEETLWLIFLFRNLINKDNEDKKDDKKIIDKNVFIENYNFNENLLSFLFFRLFNFYSGENNYMKQLVLDSFKPIAKDEDKFIEIENFLVYIKKCSKVFIKYNKTKERNICLGKYSREECKEKRVFKKNELDYLSLLKDVKFTNFFYNVSSLFFNLKDDKKITIKENNFIKKILTFNNEDFFILTKNVNNELRHNKQFKQELLDDYFTSVKELITFLSSILKSKKELLMKDVVEGEDEEKEYIEESSLKEYIFLVNPVDYKRKIKVYDKEGKLDWEKTSERRKYYEENYKENGINISKEKRIEILKEKFKKENNKKYDFYKYYYVDTALLLLRRYVNNYINSTRSIEKNISSSNLIIFERKFKRIQSCTDDHIRKYGINGRKIPNEKSMFDFINKSLQNPSKTTKIIEEVKNNKKYNDGGNIEVRFVENNSKNNKIFSVNLKQFIDVGNEGKFQSINESLLKNAKIEINNNLLKALKSTNEYKKINRSLYFDFKRELKINDKNDALTLKTIDGIRYSNDPKKKIKVNIINDKFYPYPFELTFKINYSEVLEEQDYFIYKLIKKLREHGEYNKKEKSFEKAIYFAMMNKLSESKSNSKQENKFSIKEALGLSQSEIASYIFNNTSNASIEDKQKFDNLKILIEYIKLKAKNGVDSFKEQKIIISSEADLLSFICSKKYLDKEVYEQVKHKENAFLGEIQIFKEKIRNNLSSFMEKSERHYFFRGQKGNLDNKNKDYLSWEFFKKTNGKSTGTTWIKMPKDTRKNFLDEAIKYIKNKFSENYKYEKIKQNKYYIESYRISFNNPNGKIKYNKLLEVTRKNTKIEIEEKSWIKIKYNYIISNKIKDKNIIHQFLEWTSKIKNNNDDILEIKKKKKEFIKLINFLAPQIVKKIHYMNEYNKVNDNIYIEHKDQIKKIYDEIIDFNFFKGIKLKDINNTNEKNDSFFVIKDKKAGDKIK